MRTRDTARSLSCSLLVKLRIVIVSLFRKITPKKNVSYYGYGYAARKQLQLKNNQIVRAILPQSSRLSCFVIALCSFNQTVSNGTCILPHDDQTALTDCTANRLIALNSELSACAARARVRSWYAYTLPPGFTSVHKQLWTYTLTLVNGTYQKSIYTSLFSHVGNTCANLEYIHLINTYNYNLRSHDIRWMSDNFFKPINFSSLRFAR